MGKETRAWEPWLAKHIPPKGRIAIDIGAHAGGYSAALASIYDSVIAFEPNPDLLTPLMSAVKGFGNVSIRVMAVGDVTGGVTFYRGQSTEGGSLLPVHPVNGEHPTGSFQVACTRLDDLKMPGWIDFIKIDTEGAEHKVLSGATRTLMAHRPRLLVEIHSEENWLKSRAVLEELGYEVTVIRNPIYGFKHPYFDRHLWLAARPT